MRALLLLVLAALSAPAVQAQRGLPPAVHARVLGQGIRQLVVSTAGWNYPAFLVSFNRHLAVPWDRVASVPPGTEVDADLWIEPRDPEVDALRRSFEGYRRRGEDVRVALVLPAERAGYGAASARRIAQLTQVEYPDGGPWQHFLDTPTIGPGTVFAVQTNAGALSLIHI